MPGSRPSRDRNAPAPPPPSEAKRAELVAAIRRRMGPRLCALEEPEDLLQDALVKALETASEARDPLAPARLLVLAEYRIRSLAARSTARVRPCRDTPLPAALVAIDAEAAESTPAPPARARDLAERELALRILGALDDLSFEQRASIVLRDLSGWPWVAIGAVLRTSEEAARSLRRRSLARLRSELA